MADRAGAAFAAIVGERELAAGHRDAAADADGEQETRGRSPRLADASGAAEERDERTVTDGDRDADARVRRAPRRRTPATEVTLCGWVAHRRDHGGVTFIDLRDREGVVQVVFHPEDAPDGPRGGAGPPRRVGRPGRPAPCATRPAGMANPSSPTGEIEVAATSIEVLNRGGDARRS